MTGITPAVEIAVDEAEKVILRIVAVEVAVNGIQTPCVDEVDKTLSVVVAVEVSFWLVPLISPAIGEVESALIPFGNLVPDAPTF